MDFQLNILEGATEVSVVIDNKLFLFSSVDILGWSETLNTYVHLYGSGDGGLLSPLDIVVVTTSGDRVGYIKNLFVNCLSNKVSISFDRFVWDNKAKS